MANIKSGLDYFPLDIDFFDDPKIHFVSAKFGIAGEIITIRLLTRIYRNGFFLPWSEDDSLLLSKRIGDSITTEIVQKVIQELFSRQFFSEEKFKQYGILTSHGIQKRFFEAAKRRKDLSAFKEYLLVHTLPQNVYILDGNDDILKQRKEGSKGSKETPPNPPPPKVRKRKAERHVEYSEDFLKFWNAYPPRRKTKKPEAAEGWNKSNGKPAINELLKILEIQKKSPDWVKDGGDFIPGPAPYINQRRWEDEVENNESGKSTKEKWGL